MSGILNVLLAPTAAAGGTTFSLLTHTSTSGLSSPITTSAIDTTGADLIVVGLSAFSGAAPGATPISDSKSNSWNGLTLQTGGTSAYSRLFWSRPGTVGTGHTFTCTGATAAAMAVASFSGSVASPFDVENGAGTSAAQSLQTGSVTANQNNSLYVTSFCFTDNSNVANGSIDSGFTQIEFILFGSGANEGIAFAYLIQNTAAAVNPTWTFTGGPFMNQDLAATIAAFKP